MDYPWHIFVAPVHDTCILGLDFIMQYEIDICMSYNVLFIKGEKIPLQIQGKMKLINTLNIRTVKLHQNVMIAAYSHVRYHCKSNLNILIKITFLFLTN